MNILLVRPKPKPVTIGLQSVMICEPLELMTLAAVLRAGGHNVRILDMILERRSLKYFINKYQPELVGITSYISHIGVIKEYVRQIKRKNANIKVCVGGVHAAVCPDDFSDPHIDLVCQTAEEFYRFTDCVDCMPQLPDRILPAQYTRKYYYLFQTRCALIKTSFGCLNDCNFCFCKEIEPYSARSGDDVISELLTIPQTEVYIVDDNFLHNQERLLEFADKVSQHEIKKHFLCYGCADFIAQNENIIARLHEIGLRAVIVGLESANQEELDDYNKCASVSDNIAAVKILQKYGIECYGTVILGIDWDKSDFARLYRFLKELGIVFVNLQPFTPMPGTPYFEKYKERLIIQYSQPEKWDMAHLVVKPGKMSVRQYYTQILKLYYKITITPKHTVYMFRQYGFRQTMKLSVGAFRISLQYIAKIILGVRI